MEYREKPPRSIPVTEKTTLLPFLQANLPGKSRNTVKNILARGQAEVDGQRATRHDHPLSPGQTVVLLPEGAARAALPFPLLYEDARLLAVDKPAGLLSMANEKERERTAYRAVTAYVRSRAPGRRVFIVHRLDRDTSGVLLFAKDEDMKRALQDNWTGLVRRRGYLALTEGRPPQAADTVRTLLRENAAHKVYSVPKGGREAVTRYRTLSANERFALLEVDLETGRKHQIRAHLSELGCPVAGDRTYGAAQDPLGRLCLHAHALVLRDPFTRQERSFLAPAPKEFARLAR